jgi:hypothetical protein
MIDDDDVFCLFFWRNHFGVGVPESRTNKQHII